MKNKKSSILSHTLVILTGLIMGFFLFDLITGDISKIELKNALAYSLTTIIVFYLIWILYSLMISKQTKEKFKDVLKKDAISFAPLLILTLFPLKNLVKLGAKFENLMYLPSLLLLALALSLVISIKIISFKKPIKPRISSKWIFILALLYFTIFSTLAILKHNSFNSTGFDLGIYSQTMYGLSKGKMIYSISRIPMFGAHAQLILLLILPIYMLFKSPITLIILQTLFISISSVPLYLIGKKILKNKLASLLICIAYLLYPTIQYVTLFDFHPMVLALPFAIFAFYFFDEKKYKLGILFLFLTALCKEYLTLLFVTFGIYLFFKHKKRKLGVIMSLIGVGWFIFNYKILMPHFYDASNIYLTLNPYFGTTAKEVIQTILLKPIYSLKFVLTFEKLIFLALLIFPVGLILPLLSPTILLLTITEVGITLLHTKVSIQQIIYHHIIIIIPFLFIAAIFSIKFLTKKFKTKNLAISLVTLVLVTSFMANISYGPFKVLYDLKEFNPYSEYSKTGHKFVSIIPQDSSVVAPNWIIPHLANREKVYMLSHFLGGDSTYIKSVKKVENPEYIIMDLSDALTDPKRSGRRLSKEDIDQLFNNINYSIIQSEESWVLLKKGADYEKNICKIKPFLDKNNYPHLDIEIQKGELLEKC